MKFEILKRQIELKWAHVWLTLGIVFGIAILAMLIGTAYLILSGLDLENALRYSPLTMQTVLNLVAVPITALTVIWAAQLAKMKKDIAYCRAMASANFLFTIALLVLEVVALIFFHINGTSKISDIPYFIIDHIAGFVARAAGAIILYLWLLIFLQPDEKRLKEAAPYAGIFAILIFLVGKTALLLLQNGEGMNSLSSYLQLDLDVIISLCSNFLFALAILYHTRKKLNMDAAKLYAGLYLGAALLFIFADIGGDLYMLKQGIEAVATIAFLYLLGKRGKD